MKPKTRVKKIRERPARVAPSVECTKTSEQDDVWAAQRDRRSALRRLVLAFPGSHNLHNFGKERALAIQRAQNAIIALGSTIEILADERASKRGLEDALRTANNAYCQTCLKGEPLERFAQLELVTSIRLAASDVLEGLAKIEDTRCPSWFARCAYEDRPKNIGEAKQQEAFREAVKAWVASERAMRQKGRRTGRIPDRWEPTLACLEAFGIAGEIKTGDSLKRIFMARRPDAIPLYGAD